VRLLADENVPGPLVRLLRERGHDLVWVRETLPGATDEAVLEHASVEARLLVTFDKDFGQLAVKSGLPSEAGVILFRLDGSDPDRDNQRAAAALESRDDWGGHFAVVSGARIRIRPLPAAPAPEGLD